MKRMPHSLVTRITLLGFMLSFAQPVVLGTEPVSAKPIEQTPAITINPSTVLKWMGVSFLAYVLVIACFKATLQIIQNQKPNKNQPPSISSTTLDDYIGPIPDELSTLLEELEENNGATPFQGLLIYGPHGCGKTHLARCISGSHQIPLAEITNEILDPYHGETERNIRDIFARARAWVTDKNNPSRRAIILLDEIGSMCDKKQAQSLYDDITKSIVNTIAYELNKTEENRGLIVIGCTENPRSIDSTLTSAGRLSTQVKIDLPDEETRGELFSHYLIRSKVPHIHAENPEKLTPCLKQLAQSTPNKTPADIREYLEEAARTAPQAYKKAFGTPGYKLGKADESLKEPLSRQGLARRSFYTQPVVQAEAPAPYTPTPVLTNQSIIDVINRKKAQHPVGYVVDIYE